MKKFIAAAAVLALSVQCVSARGLRIEYGNAGDDLAGYLERCLDRAGTLNETELSEVADYIEYAARIAAMTELNGGGEEIRVDGAAVADGASRGEAAIAEYNEILSERGITLNREPVCEVPVFIDGAAERFTLTIDNISLGAMSSADGVRFIYGDENEYISLTGADISSVSTIYGSFKAEISEAAGVYTIRYLDASGSVREKYAVSAGFGLPASDAAETVYIYYNDRYDNWGGQYSAADGLIEFTTPYSGDYSVSERETVISDISDLTEEERGMIRFMVSREYLEAEDGLFRPTDALSRYEFTEALVRMFFAIDNEAVCSFSDVDHENYRYVAASESRGIVEGFEDHTFRGGELVTGEQVTALAARTIHEESGYIYPDRTDVYLTFDGAENISDWARTETALAVREGIYDPAMGIAPNGAVSRKDAAAILYRLFMILNNTPERSVSDAVNAAPAEHKTFYSTANTIIVVAAVCAADAAVLYFALRRKRPRQ